MEEEPLLLVQVAKTAGVLGGVGLLVEMEVRACGELSSWREEPSASGGEPSVRVGG